MKNSQTCIEMRKEGLVVYCIKRCTEINGNDDGRFTQALLTENVIQCVKNGLAS